MTLYTIGYEGIDQERFLELLHRNGVETVIDVRELPLSRKKGFSKKGLAQALQREGLKYAHVPALGCPKPIRTRYKADGDWKRYTAAFLKHLSGQDSAIDEVAALARQETCALMCFEANHERCHRSMVASSVSATSPGMRTSHLSTPSPIPGKP